VNETRKLALVSMVVPDYDQAIAFYRDKLEFELVEDTALPDGKRWVVVRPKGGGSGILLARAASAAQRAAIGNQTGGRVFLFLETGDFSHDYQLFRSRSVEFLEQPRHEAYGTVAVFRDPFGNKWDLLERSK
jgi:catechol 2,3-dioxygenase-like lactoylglutathione lyase family enzyme